MPAARWYLPMSPDLSPDHCVFAPLAIVPVYDHQDAIEAVVAGLRAAGLSCLLVDDGSGSRCAEVLSRLALQVDVELLRLDINQGKGAAMQADFILDASGFARLLPRLLKLESPSNFPVRGAIFCHVRDHIPFGKGFDRNKILITTHPEHLDVWYWTIPFSDNTCSQGVVAEQAFFDRYPGDDLQKLQQIVGEDPNLAHLLAKAEWAVQPVRRITGYSANVTSLHGAGYALLGNAGEFLDPVFSSGVTIAFKSAQLACDCLRRQYDGESVDWERDFSVPLRAGIGTFRRFVESWYQGGFQDVIYHPRQSPEVREMICSILAGYAWDSENPYVADHSGRRLHALERLCAG